MVLELLKLNLWSSGYGPSRLPLRHSALHLVNTMNTNRHNHIREEAKQNQVS